MSSQTKGISLKGSLIMNTKKYCFIFSFALLSLFGSYRAEPDIYVFTDFAGGIQNQNQPVGDWQTAIELAGTGWKLTHHPYIFINDGAAPLDPAKASTQLAAAFPYLESTHPSKTIKRLVVHVIDPGVGNASDHPRALVLRKDGTLFVGPDNGTLSLACPPDSIAAIWEINTAHVSDITGVDLEAGGTFHGRDVFVAAAYLLAANKVQPEDIGKAYLKPELKFRVATSPPQELSVQFQEVSTSRWDIKLDNTTTKDDLFAQAYFLAIVQSPFYAKEESPQLFFIETEDADQKIAIYNRKTGNLYVGPNNGVGTAFFEGFSPQDVLAVELDHIAYRQIQECRDVKEILGLILKEKVLQKPLIAIDLLAHELESPNHSKRIVKGRIWVDAYGNIKTTLDTELFNRLRKEGYTNLTVDLNGVTKGVQLANSFAEVPSGKAFIYVGSSGAVGPNPQRSRRYVELSSNGSLGVFGADLFIKETSSPFSGQEITFWFTKDNSD